MRGVASVVSVGVKAELDIPPDTVGNPFVLAPGRATAIDRLGVGALGVAVVGRGNDRVGGAVVANREPSGRDGEGGARDHGGESFVRVGRTDLTPRR